MPSTQDESPRRPLSRRRALVFGFLSAFMILGGIEAFIAHLEHIGDIETLTPTEGIQFVDKDLFQRDGPDFVTSPYGERSLAKQRFKADFEGWRAVLLGGSFIMGDPYEKPGFVPDESKTPGSIQSWLRDRLQATSPEESVDVLNFAAPAQNSERVKQIGRIALKHRPDVLILGTGNNEGAITPHKFKIYLRRFAGFRLLWRTLRPANTDDIPTYVPQLGPRDELLAQYEQNLRTLIEEAAKQETPVLLCVMPINLRDHWSIERLGALSSSKAVHYPEGPIWQELIRPLPPTEEERRVTEQLQLVTELPPGEHGQYWTVRGIREMRLGQTEEAREHLGRFHSRCAAEGAQQWVEGDTEGAIEAFSNCTTLGQRSALSWIGAELWRQEDFEGARKAWTAQVEINPSGRTRPSYNEIARRLGQEYSHVFLAHLDDKAAEISPGGIPGEELYVDACHMNWWGYAHMADAILEALFTHNLGPEGAHLQPQRQTDKETRAESWGLPPRGELRVHP